jgi:hypothetical protein
MLGAAKAERENGAGIGVLVSVERHEAADVCKVTDRSEQAGPQ